MAVFRIQKSRDYTVMSNNHFKNRRLSLKAKGLLSLMLSLPDTWDYTLEGLVTLNADGRDSVRSALQELENEGYVNLGRERDDSGRLGSAIYDVYETPQTDFPITEKPTLVKPMLEKPISENPTQLNTNTLNTKGLNTHKSNTYVMRRPTINEIQDYCNERSNNIDAEKFYDYYESNGWKVGRNAMKDWKAAIRTWERSNNGYYKSKDREAVTRTPEEEERLAQIKRRFGTD